MNTGKMRLLAIVLIIALVAVSWYTMISNAAEDDATYNAYLGAAREKREKELVEDAQDYYLATLKLRDSVELRDEIAQFYFELTDEDTYVEFCEKMMEDYPYDRTAYERLCKLYKENGSFYSCYSVIKIANKRQVESEVLSTIAAELKNEYQLKNLGVNEVGAFSENYCAVLRHDGKWGYVNSTGATVISFAYTDARPVSSGMAAVWDQNGEFFLINTAGRKKSVDVHNRQIEDCTILRAGLIALKYDGKYHYCNWELEEQFGAYDFAGAFCDGVAVVANEGKWSIIDTTGKVISQQIFEDIKVDALGVAFRNERAFAKINGKYIMINTKGEKISGESWDDADAFKSTQPAAVKKNGKWGYVDMSGNVVCQYQYINARSFANGMAAVEIDSAWGYIGVEDYKIKIEPVFSKAMDFSTAGNAFVKKDEKWKLLRIYSLM